MPKYSKTIVSTDKGNKYFKEHIQKSLREASLNISSQQGSVFNRFARIA